MKNITSAASSQSGASGGTTVQGREGGKGRGKGYKGASQAQCGGKKDIEGKLLQGGGGQPVGGEEGRSSPPVVCGYSRALEYEEQTTG